MHHQYLVCLLLEVLLPASPAGQVRVSLSHYVLRGVVLIVVTLFTWLGIALESKEVHLTTYQPPHALPGPPAMLPAPLPPHLLRQLEVEVGEVEVALDGEARQGTMPLQPVQRPSLQI